MSMQADEDEHSIEMQLPYIAKVSSYEVFHRVNKEEMASKTE